MKKLSIIILTLITVAVIGLSTGCSSPSKERAEHELEMHNARIDLQDYKVIITSYGNQLIVFEETIDTTYPPSFWGKIRLLSIGYQDSKFISK